MKKISFLICILLCLGIGTGKAQYSVLLNFNSTNGANPRGSLVLSGDKLYGMTYNGGAHNDGCVFSLNTVSNVYTDLLDFNGTNGANPAGSLILSGRMLYGMTSYGLSSAGNIFSIDTNGNNYKDLFDFSGGLNGANPYGSLTLSGGKLYGMTRDGGRFETGNIFSIDTNGNGYKELNSFQDYRSDDGQYPFGSLILSGDVLYGMTYRGGAVYAGIIFSIDTSGHNYRDMLDFDGNTNSVNPYGSLIVSGNKLYGTTTNGGVGYGCIFSVDTNGSRYKNLFQFNGTNGANPEGSLILSNGILCGMTSKGGAHDSGCIFSIDTNGNGYTDLFDFNGSNGTNPEADLTLSGNTFYGMTNGGGSNNNGVIFSLKVTGLGINNLTANPTSINVYPNPSNGEFTIQAKSEELRGNSMVEVYNVLGEKVYDATLQPQTPEGALINISNQPNGIYLYRLVGSSGELIGEGKVIIQK